MANEFSELLKLSVSVVVFLATGVLFFSASWPAFLEGAKAVMASETSAKVVAFSLALMAAATAASIFGATAFPLAVVMAAFGTCFSRIELVFERSGRFKIVQQGITPIRMLVGLSKVIILFIAFDLITTIIAITPLPTPWSFLAQLISLIITAYGLTRDLKPYYEVAQSFSQIVSRPSLLAALFLGSIIIITLAYPWSDLLLTLTAMLGYMMAISLLFLLPRFSKSNRKNTN